MKGFTLVELLVAVVIIAILASVAVSDYQKAVGRSRASEALTLLRSLYEAEIHFFISHGHFAGSLDSLSISFKGKKVTFAQNNNSPCWGYYNTEGVQGKDWSVELEKGKNPSISIGRISGPYAGAGFFIQLQRKDGIQYPLEEVACVENKNGKYKYKKKKEGSYCVDIMDGTFYSQSGASRKYTIVF